ncbi:MAG: N-acetyl sugar amidotransferase [Gammaproteobacteria bacterium]|nr:N-acetyl sugar amidotransferase [Gammaproteobacteria bacterium]
MDTSDPDIVFDEAGHCNHCNRWFRRMHDEVPNSDAAGAILTRIVARIREEGRGRDYDCVAGVSGGVDSTFVIHQLCRLGLRPLAVHFDNGWNSELAVDNIKKSLDHLGVHLHTEVVDWEEFRSLQLAFLKASVPNCEIPTDHAITATLVKTAQRIGTRFVINGSNVITEGILPLAWVYYSHDLHHLLAIQRRFGGRSLQTYPLLPLRTLTSRIITGRYRMVNLLNYLEYDREAAIGTLEREAGWRNYGGKHYESIYTRWYQGYYLPAKFGYDKRKAHFSALVCAGQMRRDTALEKLEQSPYENHDVEDDTRFVLRKLELTAAELEELIVAPNRRHTDYPNSGFLIDGLAGARNFLRARAKQV